MQKVMIVGCGRLGATVANALVDRGDEVTILDMNPENFRRLHARPGLAMYVGDGMSHEVLRRRGQDTTNALAAQSAQTTFSIGHVVCRINDPIRSAMYQDLGLTTVNSSLLLVDLVLSAME